MSDIHGHLGEMGSLLRDGGLIDPSGDWNGGQAELWILGDYVDRGPDGLGVVQAVRGLQTAATASGGAIHALLGNHELQFLAALHFGDRAISGDGESTFAANWRQYGGDDEDLEAVTDDQVHWMTGLPLVDVADKDLLLHSDTVRYLELGSSVDAINEAGRAILQGRDSRDWARLHQIMTARGDFLTAGGREQLMTTLDVRRIVHGHSTLRGGFGLSGLAAEQPFSYGEGSVLALDGGVFEEHGRLLLARL